MMRFRTTPRPDWQAKVERLGLLFQPDDLAYWDESVCYRFTLDEINVLEAATNELHARCLDAVQRVIDQNLFGRFGIPARFVPLIVSSWEREDLSLYGRFDLWFDGKEAPKLYEYNADTPTSLLEASVVQWDWLQETRPRYDQFNSIHDKLIARWRESGLGEQTLVHFACVRDHLEDLATTAYLQDTAMQAALRTERLFMDEIGWDGRRFVDVVGRPIQRLFKLYPWEWFIDEAFSPHLLAEPWRVVEPAWKMVLSNKCILPLLWEMFPGHPNLLPAFHEPDKLDGNYVREPARGREGAGVSAFVRGKRVIRTPPGEHESKQAVYQAWWPLPDFDGARPVVGSWIVRDEAAGIGVREDETEVTRNTSRFVPHFFVP